MEGKHCYAASSCDGSGLALPVLGVQSRPGLFHHGRLRYEEARSPRYRATTSLQTTAGDGSGASDIRTAQALDSFQWPTLTPGGSITSFGEDASGELYIASADGRCSSSSPMTDQTDLEALRRVFPRGSVWRSSWNYPGWRGLVYHRDYRRKRCSAGCWRNTPRFRSSAPWA